MESMVRAMSLISRFHPLYSEEIISVDHLPLLNTANIGASFSPSTYATAAHESGVIAVEVWFPIIELVESKVAVARGEPSAGSSQGRSKLSSGR